MKIFTTLYEVKPISGTLGLSTLTLKEEKIEDVIFYDKKVLIGENIGTLKDFNYIFYMPNKVGTKLNTKIIINEYSTIYYCALPFLDRQLIKLMFGNQWIQKEGKIEWIIGLILSFVSGWWAQILFTYIMSIIKTH